MPLYDKIFFFILAIALIGNGCMQEQYTNFKMRGQLPELYTVLHLAQPLSLSFQKKVKFSYQYSGFQKSSHTTFIMYVCNCRSLCGKKTGDAS